MSVTYAPDIWTIPLFYDCPNGCRGSAPSGRFHFGADSDVWPQWRAETDGANTLVAGVMVECPKCKTPMYARNWTTSDPSSGDTK